MMTIPTSSPCIQRFSWSTIGELGTESGPDPQEQDEPLVYFSSFCPCLRYS